MCVLCEKFAKWIFARKILYVIRDFCIFLIDFCVGVVVNCGFGVFDFFLELILPISLVQWSPDSIRM